MNKHKFNDYITIKSKQVHAWGWFILMIRLMIRLFMHVFWFYANIVIEFVLIHRFIKFHKMHTHPVKCLIYFYY